MASYSLPATGESKEQTHLSSLDVVDVLASHSARVGEDGSAVAPLVVVDDLDGVIKRGDAQAHLKCSREPYDVTKGHDRTRTGPKISSV